MHANPRVIRLDPAGPDGAGLQPLELDPATFQSALPVQNYHLYFEDESIGLSVGIWDTTTMQEAFGPYPTDEFILVLEGAFAMVNGEGGAVTAKAGDSVCFHQGIPTSWKQDGYLRKVYLTLADPAAGMPVKASAEGGVIVLRQPPESDGAIVYRNDPGTMVVRHIASGAFESPLDAAQAHMLVQLLSGEVEVNEPGGVSQVFRAGQVFFIPQGTVHGMKASTGFRAYRVSVGQ
ncbi:MAG: DUF861 domain-containing protein [Paracoccaceae bacterium]|nr:MAG: DUF861 domain-containing protein [Paracoccaceae bacterium]